MIQLNLLPDVKLEYIKTQRLRRLVISLSVIITGISVGIMLLLLVYNLAQKKHLNDLNNNINSEISTLQGKPDLDKILTVQNQLESLTVLHEAKPNVAALFSTYLNELTPTTASISSLNLDFATSSISIAGDADSIATVNQFVDTFKFTNFTVNNSKSSTSAFSDVVLSSFGFNTGAQDPNQAVSYTITLSFNPEIFKNTETINLVVPTKITTRSELAQPTNLFKSEPSSSSNSGGQ